MSNEIAIQQALMRADAAIKGINDLAPRVAALEAFVRAAMGQAVPAPAAAPAVAPAAAPAAAPVVGTPDPATALTPNLGGAVAPWVSLLGAVVQSAAADVLPTLRALQQQPGQGGASVLGGLLASLLPPGAPAAPPGGQAPQHRHFPGVARVTTPAPDAPAAPAAAPAPTPGVPGAPVSASELSWLAEEGGAAEAGPVVAAQQTTALPPGYQSMQPAYQQPGGVAPAAAPFVQMPR